VQALQDRAGQAKPAVALPIGTVAQRQSAKASDASSQAPDPRRAMPLMTLRKLSSSTGAGNPARQGVAQKAPSRSILRHPISNSSPQARAISGKPGVARGGESASARDV